MGESHASRGPVETARALFPARLVLRLAGDATDGGDSARGRGSDADSEQSSADVADDDVDIDINTKFTLDFDALPDEVLQMVGLPSSLSSPSPSPPPAPAARVHTYMPTPARTHTHTHTHAHAHRAPVRFVS